MNILEEANKITQKDRQQAYGNPADNFQHIAKISSAITGKQITAEDVIMVHFATKVARERHKPKRDNRVDIAGYAWVYDQIQQKKEE